MVKMISIATILMTGWFFCLGSNMLLAEGYTSVEDIELDGKDAIGKKATLCVQKLSVDPEDSYGKNFTAVDGGKGTHLIHIYFDKDQKELVKKIEPNGGRYCTMVTIIIDNEGLYRPSGRLISVGK